MGQVSLEVIHVIHRGAEQGEFQFYSLANHINLCCNIRGQGNDPGAHLHKLVVMSVNLGQGKVEAAKEGIIIAFCDGTGLLVIHAHQCKEHVIAA
jgi:hypothetical protein